MKSSNLSNRLFLLVLPFLLTGCYTQLQTADRYSLEDDRHSDYYAWDGYENGVSQEDFYEAEEERYLETQYALEEAGIYYKDYETEEWYKENNAENMYWTGYEDGYGNGYEDGFDDAYYRQNSLGYGNLHLYSHSHRFHRHYIWGAGFGVHFSGVRGSWVSNMRYAYSPTGYWYYTGAGFLMYMWHPFQYNGYYSNYGYGSSYGYAGYYGNPYYNTLVVYNQYNKTQRYKRSAELHRKGLRNSGLVNRDYIRTRSKVNSNQRTRGTSIRNRATTTGSRVRSTGRSGSVGRSSGNVGRTRGSSGSGSGSGSSRSRGSGNNIKGSSSDNNSSGSGSSVGRSRSNNGTGSSVNKSRSSSSSSSSRSRGSGNLSSNDKRYDINRSSTSRTGSTYTIPVTGVDYAKRVRTSRSSFLNNRNAFRSVQTKNPAVLKFGNRSVRSSNSSSILGRTVRKTINNSSSRSSSVKRSTNTRSVSRSTNSRGNSRSSDKSSGSSKRSRGGN